MIALSLENAIKLMYLIFMHILNKLKLFLRPPGGGIYAVSSGSDIALPLWKSIYKTTQDNKVFSIWKKNLQNIHHAKVILIGIPSDVGAGYLRGANMGPIEIRKVFYRNKYVQSCLKSKDLIDIGDVRVIPQLLYDEMLNSKQIREHRKQMYSSHQSLPVSPLSILQEVIHILFSLNPNIKILAIGGDHSITWPILKAYAQKFQRNFCVLHIDAHTDLLKSRLGIDYCFGTWAYHANNLIGRNKRLVQVGIRKSGKPKSHWEKMLDVKQFWAKDILKNPKKAQSQILSHLRSLDLNQVYISNDIDGTGMEYAAATGTAEPQGLTPKFVCDLIQKVGQEFEVIGSDLVEVAPVLHLDHTGEPQKTLKVSTQYLVQTLKEIL